MENFVQWKFVTECMVPRMDHWSSHRFLWWYIDSNSVIFCLRSFKCSMENGNWENWYSKLYSRERTYTSYIETDNCYFLYWQINIETHVQNKWKVENFCSQFSQWPLHIPNPKTWTRWHVSSCYSRSPELSCSINCIWNTEFVYPLLRSKDGNLSTLEY